MFCRHCQRAVISRPRRLCWSCYYQPEIRDLYPPTSKFARRGLGNGYVVSVPAPYPTQALPGTPEKIAILQQRAIAHQSLFHPSDAPFHAAALVPAMAG